MRSGVTADSVARPSALARRAWRRRNRVEADMRADLLDQVRFDRDVEAKARAASRASRPQSRSTRMLERARASPSTSRSGIVSRRARRACARGAAHSARRFGSRPRMFGERKGPASPPADREQQLRRALDCARLLRRIHAAFEALRRIRHAGRSGGRGPRSRRAGRTRASKKIDVRRGAARAVDWPPMTPASPPAPRSSAITSTSSRSSISLPSSSVSVSPGAAQPHDDRRRRACRGRTHASAGRARASRSS